MGQTTVAVPLINSNEDSVRLVAWHAAAGERVRAGGLLATVETAKAAMDLEAERDGFVRWRAACPEGTAAVGAALMILTDAPDEAFEVPAGDASAAAAEPAIAGVSIDGPPGRATLKARVLARRLGVDLAAIGPAGGGVITEAVVRSSAGDPLRRAAAAPAPALAAMIEGGSGGVPAVIAGDGAHARWIADTVRRAGGFRIVGCTSPELPCGGRSGDLSVLGADEDLPGIRAAGVGAAFVGVGSSRSGRRSNDTRARIFARLQAAGFLLPVLIDPDASVSESATLGEGTVVGAKAVVSAHVRIGRNVLVNAGAIVCHDAVVEDHVHLTPGAILAGTTSVGEGSTIGMAATVLDGTRVGRRCLVPNGTRVIKDLPDDAVAAD